MPRIPSVFEIRPFGRTNRNSAFRFKPEPPSVSLLWRDRCHELERRLRIANAEIERLKEAANA